MDTNERLELVTRNIQEIIPKEDLIKLLQKKKKPVIYWGTAPTGKPHIGYLLPALKIADLLKAGFKVKILLADIHAALDNVEWTVLEKRYKYYEKVIPLLIQCIGVDTKNLEFVKGSDYQLKKDFIFDVLKLSTIVSVHDAHKAASDVVKMGENPKLSGLLYPLMQALDEEYLGVDAQLGGTDQRKIMVLARENLPKIGYASRVEIMNPIIPGLIGKKMSSSDPKSKIDLLDSDEEIKSKIKGAYCEAGKVEDNGVLAFVQYVLFTIKSDQKAPLIIERPEKFGGNQVYYTYSDLESDFINQKLHPQDLKNTLAKELILLLKPMQKYKTELESLAKEAYS
jgi:tyrosyl-tRNA synthetase